MNAGPMEGLAGVNIANPRQQSLVQKPHFYRLRGAGERSPQRLRGPVLIQGFRPELKNRRGIQRKAPETPGIDEKQRAAVEADTADEVTRGRIHGLLEA